MCAEATYLGPRNSWLIVTIGALFVALAAGFVALVYHTPWGFNPWLQMDHSAVQLYAQALLAHAPAPFSAPGFTWGGIVLLGGQWLLYAGAAVLAYRQRLVVTLPALLVVPLLVAGGYLFLPHIFSSDVGVYAMQARVGTLAGGNPYVVAPTPVDPSFLVRPWNQPFLYGPLALLQLRGAVALAGPNLLAEVVALKVYGAVLHLLTCGCVYYTARRLWPAQAGLAALLYGWNPLVLLENVGGGHNDGWLAALVAGSFLCYVLGPRWRGLGLVLALASVLVKYVSLPYVLFYVVAWSRSRDGQSWRSWLSQVGRSLGAALGLTAGTWLLLPRGSFAAAAQALVQRASEVTVVPILTVALHSAQVAQSTLSSTTAAALTQGVTWTGRLTFGIAVLVVLGIALLLLRGQGTPAQLADAWGVTMLIALLFLSPSLFPWYLSWTLPAVVVVVPGAGGPARRVFIMLCGLAVALQWLYFIPA